MRLMIRKVKNATGGQFAQNESPTRATCLILAGVASIVAHAVTSIAFCQGQPVTASRTGSNDLAIGHQDDMRGPQRTSVIATSETEPVSEAELRTLIRSINERLRNSPNDIDLLINRGAAYSRIGEFQKADADVSAAIEKSPDNASAWYVLGQIKRETGQSNDAINAFNKAANLGFDDAQLYVELGLSLEAVGDADGAIANFSKAIERKFSKGYYCRAMLRRKIGDTELAIADFDKALELLGTHPGILFERGFAHQILGNYSAAIRDYVSVTQLVSDAAEPHAGLGQVYAAQGDWNAAVSEFNRAIEIRPKDPYFYAIRGCARIKYNEYAKGIEDIKRAIALNSGDLGATYRATTGKVLTAEALAHGETQVRRMLRDRPAMATHVVRGDKLWTWAVRKFAGEDLGTLIDWNSGTPSVHWADSRAPMPGTNARIRVATTRSNATKEKPASFEELWSSAVYELHNVCASAEWLRLYGQALEGTITCEQFVDACMQSERPALERTRAFYISYFLDWMKTSGLQETNPTDWFCNRFSAHSQAADNLGGFDLRPRYFTFSFLSLCVERELNLGNHLQAKALLAKMLEYKDLSDETRLLGRFKSAQVSFATGDFQSAIEEFAAVIASDPRHEQAILLRGIAYSRLEEYDNALADFNRALSLNPGLVDALAVRSDEYARRGNLKGAQLDLERALSLSPQNAGLYTRRGFDRSDTTDVSVLKAAMDDFAKAIELNPNEAQAYRGRARVLRKLGKLDKAIADLDVTIRLIPDLAIAYLERGICHFENQEWRQALDDYNESIKIFAASQWAYAARAKLRLESKDSTVRNLAEALSDAKRSCELSQWASAEELSLLASVYAAQSDVANAVKWQEKAVSLSSPSDKESYTKTLESYKQKQSGRGRAKPQDSGAKVMCVQRLRLAA